MNKTGIPWADLTWNPLIGCARVSPGCERCYAEQMSARLTRLHPDSGRYKQVVRITEQGARWTRRSDVVDGEMCAPLVRKKPATIFLGSMTDVLWEAHDPLQVLRVFAVMFRCPRHRFLVLTKRPDRFPAVVEAWLSMTEPAARFDVRLDRAGVPPSEHRAIHALIHQIRERGPLWPLLNVDLGVTVESPSCVNRLQLLLHLPAVRRFVSAEPLLEPWAPPGGWNITVKSGRRPAVIDGLILGGETGDGARRCDLDGMGQMAADAHEAGVAVHMKQLGSKPELGGQRYRKTHPHGADPRDWPETWPRAAHLRDWPGPIDGFSMPLAMRGLADKVAQALSPYPPLSQWPEMETES